MRKKPSQLRSRKSVDAVLGASAQVLSTHGYVSTTTNRIAERAGVSVGTLYQYFGNKDDIFNALLLRESGAYLAAIASSIDTIQGDLATAMRGLLTAGFQHKELILGLREVMHHAPERIFRQHSHELREELHGLVVHFLREQRLGYTESELEDHADIVIGICESQIFLARRERTPGELIEYLTRAICQYLQ